MNKIDTIIAQLTNRESLEIDKKLELADRINILPLKQC